MNKVTIELTTDAPLGDIMAAIDMVEYESISLQVEDVSKIAADGSTVRATTSRPAPDPRLVFVVDKNGNSTKIDIDASLVKLNMTADGVNARPWKRGTAEHSVKQAMSRQRGWMENTGGNAAAAAAAGADLGR